MNSLFIRIMNFDTAILDFLFNLRLPFILPKDVEVLDAHQREDVRRACTSFYKKYYGDSHQRHLLIGINPGRFGGGITGIPFTDPIRLEKICGIENDFQKKQELSSVFIYEMIDAFGGAKKFYHQFYISAVSPLGFVKHGRNLNYYDDKELMQRIQPFVVDCMQQQIAFGLKTDVCFCIGEGENFKYFQKLNAQYNWFNKIETLAHPRFVMQYRLKRKEEFISDYVRKLSSVI
jgi:hypothetical protein